MSKQPVVKVDRSSFALDRSGMITFVTLINQFKEQQRQQQPTNLYANLKTLYKKTE